jgi:hypothetical protein
MSAWRWVLYIVMTRFEQPEGDYLRLPQARTVRRTIHLDSDAQPRSPRESSAVPRFARPAGRAW